MATRHVHDYDNVGTVVKKPKYLAHVVLRTTTDNFDKMVRYYKIFLSAHASHENDTLSFLTYDEEHHRIAIVAVPDTIPKPSNSTGLRHIAFTFDNLDDLAIAYRQRKAHGIVPVRCINHGPTTSMYYADPDGNELETQVDNFDTAEAATKFMDSEEFKQNPIGVDFDPEEMIKRLASGDSHQSIKKRPNIGVRTSV